MLPRRPTNSATYSKVDEIINEDSTDGESNETQKSASSTSSSDHNSCRQRIYEYIKTQTSLAFLILYAYLYWYLLIMLSFGIKNMPTDAWITGTH